MQGGDDAPELAPASVTDRSVSPQQNSQQRSENDRVGSPVFSPISQSQTYTNYPPVEAVPLTPGLKVYPKPETLRTTSPRAPSWARDHPWQFVQASPARPLACADAPEVVRKPGEEVERVAGCSVLLLLWCIIGILLAATVGLAAGTGVEASRASNYAAQLQSMSASLSRPSPTSSSPTSTATAFNAIDKGCTLTAATVNGTTYRSFSCESPFSDIQSSSGLVHFGADYDTVLGNNTFEVWCRTDTPHKPILSLFTEDFDTCMDACASYSTYTSSDFGIYVNGSSNSTCQGVSFIPLWTNKSSALVGKAPGNCYLKPGPLSLSSLKVPKIGTECHAAFVIPDGLS
jgi:hypothetical protein